MGTSPKSKMDRITTTSTAWKTHRPDKMIAGMTLEQFNAGTAPSITARANIAAFESSLKAEISLREMADDKSADLIDAVVKAVVADPEEGEDGEFYEALGYVRASERKSGLHRKTKPDDTKPAT